MAKHTTLLGALLTILGTGTFALIRFAPNKWTALLPALFGLLFLVLGLLARRQPARSRLFIYIAYGLALLVVIGTAEGVIETATLVAGKQVDRPAAAVEEAITAVLCAGFLTRTTYALWGTKQQAIEERA